MTRNEELALIIRLTCLIEDRTDQEQRALVKLAWDCDRENNRLTISNRARRSPGWSWSDLVSEVQETRVLEEGRGQREVAFPKRWAETWAMWAREAPVVEVGLAVPLAVRAAPRGG